jgi:hypothetical protein
MRIPVESDNRGFWRTTTDSKKNAQPFAGRAFAPILLGLRRYRKLLIVRVTGRRSNQLSYSATLILRGFALFL